MSNYAYIGLLTTDNDYILGILALSKALKRVNSKYPFYTLITDNVSAKTEQLLNNNGIQTIRKKSLKIPKKIIEKNNKGDFSHWSFAFDKLSIFELTQFQKVVFLDADAYVRKNIDILFNKNHMSASPNRKYGPSVTIPLELCSGLLIVEPKNGYIQDFFKIINSIYEQKDSLGDQDILQEYYKNWKNQTELHLDLRFSVFYNYLDYYISKSNYNLEDIHIFQFLLNKKPWSFSNNDVEEYLNYINNRVSYLYEKYKTQDLLECINSGNVNKKIIIKEYLDLIEECKLDIKGSI